KPLRRAGRLPLWSGLSMEAESPVEEPRPVHPIALAMAWVSRIFAAVILMVSPGLAGSWVDARWGTKWAALLGMAAGLVAGVAYLIAITRAMTRGKRRSVEPDDPSTAG
ncbi:MAG: hypothetical protein KDA61_06495, partial [Planctomycetales bacterium]|nr:hypothetical protein [Planctomycetales bacterium]